MERPSIWPARKERQRIASAITKDRLTKIEDCLDKITQDRLGKIEDRLDVISDNVSKILSMMQQRSDIGKPPGLDQRSEIPSPPVSAAHVPNVEMRLDRLETLIVTSSMLAPSVDEVLSNLLWKRHAVEPEAESSPDVKRKLKEEFDSVRGVSEQRGLDSIPEAVENVVVKVHEKQREEECRESESNLGFTGGQRTVKEKVSAMKAVVGKRLESDDDDADLPPLVRRLSPFASTKINKTVPVDGDDVLEHFPETKLEIDLELFPQPGWRGFLTQDLKIFSDSKCCVSVAFLEHLAVDGKPRSVIVEEFDVDHASVAVRWLIDFCNDEWGHGWMKLYDGSGNVTLQIMDI